MKNKMKTFVTKATHEYFVGRQERKITMTLEVEAISKKDAINEIRDCIVGTYGHGIFNIIYINEI